MTITEVLDAYGAAWNEDDAEVREARLRESFADDGTYCDPTVEVVGSRAFGEHIGRTRESFGPFRIERTSGYDEHHGYGRFSWRMESSAGELIVDGFDVVQLAADGRLRTIIGFFGPFPAR